MEKLYSGVDILEALESAHNYNDYITRLVRESTESTDLIDFGAGIGTFSKRLRTAGYRVTCIEPDPLQRQRLEEQGFDTLRNIAAVADNSAPFIFALNVIEHIEDDSGAIREIRRKLKPGGILLIYVPAFGCLWTGLDEKLGHYRRYTKASLRRLVEQEGLAIKHVRYADCLGFIAALVFRLLNRSASTVTAKTISLYDRWLFAPSRVLDKLFSQWFGKNVYVLCKRRVGTVNRQLDTIGTTMRERTAKHKLKMVASKLTSRFVAHTRLLFFLVAAASISLALQLQIGYAQNASKLPTLDVKMHAVQNSITDPTASPIQDKGGQVVNVKTFGAVGDAVTNDTEAFNAALASLAKAGGGTCLVPKGTYLISATTNPAVTSHVSSNVHLVGEGREVSILKIDGVPAGNFLFCSGDNWSVEDLAIDMQDYFIRRAGFAAIVATGSNWRIANCAIVKIGRRGILVNGGANGYIDGNLISKTSASPIDNSAIISVVDGKGNFPINIHVINNVCVNSMVYFKDGKDSVIARNRISGSRFGTGIITGVHSDNISVINNTCSGGRGRDETKTYVSGFELWSPNSVIANNTSYDNDGSGIAVGGNNCIVIGNRCWNNAGLSGAVGGSGIVAVAHKRLPNAASGSLFIGNSCFDTRPRGAMTQAYGYNEPSNGLKDIKQFGNDYGRNKMGPTHSGNVFGRPNVLQIHANDAARSPISSEMKNKLKALSSADDAGMSDSTRRILREYLDQ